MKKPDLSHIPDFYQRYVQLVEADHLVTALQQNAEKTRAYFSRLAPGKWDYRYAEGKWSVKDILQHLLDAERVFVYRAMRFARRDETPLPGFDENYYADNADAGSRKPEDLLKEFTALRESTILFFDSISEEAGQRRGSANNNPISVVAIGYLIAGHGEHHLKVLAERYG